jgi:hypothetical protein
VATNTHHHIFQAEMASGPGVPESEVGVVYAHMRVVDPQSLNEAEQWRFQVLKDFAEKNHLNICQTTAPAVQLAPNESRYGQLLMSFDTEPSVTHSPGALEPGQLEILIKEIPAGLRSSIENETSRIVEELAQMREREEQRLSKGDDFVSAHDLQESLTDLSLIKHGFNEHWAEWIEAQSISDIESGVQSGVVTLPSGTSSGVFFTEYRGEKVLTQSPEGYSMMLLNDLSDQEITEIKVKPAPFGHGDMRFIIDTPTEVVSIGVEKDMSVMAFYQIDSIERQERRAAALHDLEKENMERIPASDKEIASLELPEPTIEDFGIDISERTPQEQMEVALKDATRAYLREDLMNLANGPGIGE